MPVSLKTVNLTLVKPSHLGREPTRQGSGGSQEHWLSLPLVWVPLHNGPPQPSLGARSHALLVEVILNVSDKRGVNCSFPQDREL